MISKAWARAVEHDATVIIFDCGNEIRVGIRHRARQTLFLSDMISLSDCGGAPYGKLILGILLAAIQDVKARASQLEREASESEYPTLPLKRSLDMPVSRTCIDETCTAKNPDDTDISLQVGTSYSHPIILTYTTPGCFQDGTETSPGAHVS